MITRALGTDPDVDVDTFSVAAQAGDVFLICSDGLSDMVDGEQIEAIVKTHRDDLDAAAKALVQAANRAGGEDNITAVLFELVDGEPTEPDERTREISCSRSTTRTRFTRRTASRLHRRQPLEPPAPVDTMVVAAAGSPGGNRGPEPRATAGRHRQAPSGTRRDRGPDRRDRRARLVGARALTLSYRNRELVYLAVVGVLTAIGFASVYIARQSLVSWGSLGYAVFFFALYIAAHIVTRLTVPNADPYLLPMAGLLTAIGVTEIYRLGVSDAFKQGLWIVVGVALFALALWGLRRDYRVLEQYKYLFGIGAIVLLFLPRVPGIGTTVNGARLWVHVGSFTFQPGEFSKIFLIVFLAAYLREKREVLAQARLKDVGPLLVIWGACMLVLVSSNDLGSGLLYFGIFLAMLYIATARLSFVVAGMVLFLAGGFAAYQRIGHVHERVTIWLHPWTTQKVYCPSTGGLSLRQDCQSYQLVKSLYSIGNGGFGGAGLGKGTFATTDGHQLIPFINSDFIYSALAQELGLVGAAALLLVFMLFVARGMKIALQADDGFSKLLAAGLTFGFALQTFIIVGGVLRIIPLTGITLPFVSYGGSSVVANFLLLAGLLLVSDRANSTR